MRSFAVVVLGLPSLWFVARQDGPAAAPAARPLAAIAPLIGRDWIGDLPGGKVTDTQRFEWVYGDKFVRNRHWVRTPDGKTVYEGETIYAVDARAGNIAWWYWNTTGGYVTGTVTVGEDGVLSIVGENHGAKEQLDEIRQTIRIGEGTWSVRTSKQAGGKWVEQPERGYRPVP